MNDFKLKPYDPSKYGKSLEVGSHFVYSIECDDNGVHYILHPNEENCAGYSICIDPRDPHKAQINYLPTYEEEYEDDQQQIKESKNANNF